MVNDGIVFLSVGAGKDNTVWKRTAYRDPSGAECRPHTICGGYGE